MRYFIYLDKLVNATITTLFEPGHYTRLTNAERIAMYNDLRDLIVKAHKEHGFITQYQMTVLLEKLEDGIQ